MILLYLCPYGDAGRGGQQCFQPDGLTGSFGVAALHHHVLQHSGGGGVLLIRVAQTIFARVSGVS